MDEQWNSALDQVKDEYLMEAVTYRPQRHWVKVVGAAAAVLVLVLGWSVLRPFMQAPDTSGTPPVISPEPPDAGIPGNEPIYGMDQSGGGGLAGAEPTEGINAAEPDYETLHFDTYEQFRKACSDQQRWYISDQVLIPLFDGQPAEIQEIAVFEKEMYNEPWVWYVISHTPHLTIRIPAQPWLTKGMDPGVSASEALYQLWPSAPNLHNRDEFKESYSEIREVEITTAEGVKTALYRLEADRDRAYLTFLQSGTLVTVSGPQAVIDGDWLETFSLMPIGA